MKMTSADFRKAARTTLKGQWGTFALLTLLSGLINYFITAILGALFHDNSTIIWLSGIFLTFAFSYGLYIAALRTVRGEKAEVSMLFNVFSEGRYVPMLLINIVSKVVSFIISFIIFIPAISVVGIGAVIALVFTSGTGVSMSQDAVATGGIGALLGLTTILTLIALGFSLIIGAYFQIAVQARYDFPQLGFGDLFKYVNQLLKGKIWSLFVLQLSFIGWYLISMVGLFIPLLWVFPYNQVAITEFYVVAKSELNK
ncbi:DUF975 family protein [Carnobacterium divergens]